MIRDSTCHETCPQLLALPYCMTGSVEDNACRGLAGVFRKNADVFWLEPAWINRAVGMLVHTTEGIELAYTLLVTDGKISQVLAVRNPHKLAGVSPCVIAGSHPQPL